MKGWVRARFKANADDPRPVNFPPPGPFWISGHTGDMRHAIVIAYVKRTDEIKAYWPEAEEIECDKDVPIEFSDRFPIPEWWAK